MDKTFYEKLVPSLKARSIINRLAKAFIGGALGNIALLTIVMPKNWAEISTVLAMVTFACLAGGITGVILALQKWYSWKD
jgi:hypothetical protein